jgi:hypothetical protein
MIDVGVNAVMNDFNALLCLLWHFISTTIHASVAGIAQGEAEETLPSTEEQSSDSILCNRGKKMRVPVCLPIVSVFQLRKQSDCLVVRTGD